VDMYAKCWSLEDTLRMFNKMPSQNVVSWSTMILGCDMWASAEGAGTV
jgi:hypothetical protein